MFIVYVKHYLNNEGLKYFHDIWFPKVKAIMSQQHGYISVTHNADRDNKDTVNVIVTFNNKANLEKWAEHPDHDELVNALDSHRCRTYWEYACAEDESFSYDKLEWEKVQPTSP